MAWRTKTRTWHAVLPNRSRAAHRNKTTFTSDADFNRTLRNRGIRRHRRTITRRGNTRLWSTKGGGLYENRISRRIQPIVNIRRWTRATRAFTDARGCTCIEIMRGKSQDWITYGIAGPRGHESNLRARATPLVGTPGKIIRISSIFAAKGEYFQHPHAPRPPPCISIYQWLRDTRPDRKI